MVTSRIREAVMGLPPGAFAFVMATGILSVGLSRQELAGASRIGLVLAGTAWVALLMLTAGRLLWYRDRVVADIHDPGRAFGFFTLAAGTNVLAVRLADDYRLLAVGLLALGFVTGLLLALCGALDRSPVPDRATGAVRGRWDLVHLGGRRPVHRHRVGQSRTSGVHRERRTRRRSGGGMVGGDRSLRRLCGVRGPASHALSAAATGS